MAAWSTQRSLADQRGFTLIEILVAVTVLAVGILGASRLLVSSEAATVDSELQQIATQEAEQAIEDVRAFDYEEIGHPTGALANGGQPFQSPDAPVAEDIVEVDPGSGVAASRDFTVERGGNKPPVTGTIETYVTWRDEECSPLDVSQLPPIVTLTGRVNALEGELDDLAGPEGLVTKTWTGIDAFLESTFYPGTPPPENLEAELRDNVEAPMNTAWDNASLAQQKLAQVAGMIDLCDLASADLQGLKTLLEVDSSGLEPLTAHLVTLKTALTDVQTNLAILVEGVASGTEGILCGVVVPHEICGAFDSGVNAALQVLKGAGPGQTEAISEELAAVNPVLAEIAGVELGDLSRDTTHNTKRITVAVSIDAGAPGATPKNKVWLSTVATDPEAGLIIDSSLP